MPSVKLQTTTCVSPACDAPSQLICRHCSQQYCQLCFLCHRKSVLDDMKSISEQMAVNRRQGVAEVVSFIDKQAKDAHDQAKRLLDDAIDRIVKASKNIFNYIETRRQAKLGRLDECLQMFDKDAEVLNSRLSDEIFLPAEFLRDLRRIYAYNMFDSMNEQVETKKTEQQEKNEQFFKDYRLYDEMVNLRQKWKFLQAALTTVYFPGKKEISLDKILTFLEYRHDRVLENYRDHLSKSEESKELSKKPVEDLLNGLSFLSKNELAQDIDNFYLIESTVNEIEIETGSPAEASSNQTDSGHVDDDGQSTSSSTQSWLIEDALDDDYDTRFEKLTQSMKILEKQFEQDFRPFVNNEKLE